MCFSAAANFVATGAIATVGVATLPHVRHPRGVLFAALPLAFALHQFTEGFVWLGLDGRIGPLALDHAAFLFILYAQGILPLLIPVAVLLMEPPGWRRTGRRSPGWRWSAIAALTILGALLCIWVVRAVVGLPSQAFVDHHSITYHNPDTDNGWVAGLYVIVTCGALLLSTHRVVRWFGILNVVGLTVVLVVKGYAFTSVWCLYAAILSIMIYWQYSRGHIDIEHPNSSWGAPDRA